MFPTTRYKGIRLFYPILHSLQLNDFRNKEVFWSILDENILYTILSSITCSNILDCGELCTYTKYNFKDVRF